MAFFLAMSSTSIARDQLDNKSTSSHNLLLRKITESTRTMLSTTSESIVSLIETGFGYLGIRYRWGGTGPEFGGFDCSGLVKKVFGDSLGISLPRTAAEMAKVGDKIGKRSLIPGDLVFFNTMNRAFSHVGIYLGNSQFLHAPSTGGAVRIENMNTSYWLKRFNGGRRVIEAADSRSSG